MEFYWAPFGVYENWRIVIYISGGVGAVFLSTQPMIRYLLIKN